MRTLSKGSMKKDLPIFYYLEHWLYVIEYVNNQYQHILSPDIKKFIHDFYRLDKSSQALFTRTINKKKHVFSVDVFEYGEIDDIQSASSILIAQGFFKNPEIDSLLDVFQSLTLKDLKSLIESNAIFLKKGMSTKAKLIAELSEFYQQNAYRELPFKLESFVINNYLGCVEVIQYLYFGNLKNNTSQFALRDLGVVKSKKKRIASQNYKSIVDVKNEIFLEQVVLKLGRKNIIELGSEHQSKLLSLIPSTRKAKKLKGDALLLLAKIKIKKGLTEEAFSHLKNSNHPQSDIDFIKLAIKKRSQDELQKILEDYIDNPPNDETYYFAIDCYARLFKGASLKENTLVLKESETIFLDEAFKSSPEWGAVQHYQRLGFRAYRTENKFWRCLFRLVFWDVLFEGDEVYSSEFDRLPQAVINNTFYSQFKQQINDTLHKIEKGQGFHRLLKNLTAHMGQPNGIFRSSWINIEAITTFFENADNQAISQMLRLIAENYLQMRDGYPDMMLLDKNGLQFVEIKAEGDVIRQNQMVRMKQLSNIGIQTKVIKVHYFFNPEQPYTVVDIETTGGKSGLHRITEIAAIKMVNNQVIDKWHTLINPERHIPKNITKLTGISNDDSRATS